MDHTKTLLGQHCLSSGKLLKKTQQEKRKTQSVPCTFSESSNIQFRALLRERWFCTFLIVLKWFSQICWICFRNHVFCQHSEHFHNLVRCNVEIHVQKTPSGSLFWCSLALFGNAPCSPSAHTRDFKDL